MTNQKKLIPCRVCGKEFEPCSYCQSHADIFRWRNFACSKECAVKYVNEAEAYRNANRKESTDANKTPVNISDVNTTESKTKTNNKKNSKTSTATNIETDIVNKDNGIKK